MNRFRSRFAGKVSPVHFFWGAMDMAVTRFSGRTAPRHPGGAPNCGDWVMVEGYSHELASCGFWPGGGEEGAFYAYAYPEPDGYGAAPVTPEAAFYSTEFRQFLLPYEAVRTAADPDATLLEFLQIDLRRGGRPGALGPRRARVRPRRGRPPRRYLRRSRPARSGSDVLGLDSLVPLSRRTQPVAPICSKRRRASRRARSRAASSPRRSARSARNSSTRGAKITAPVAAASSDTRSSAASISSAGASAATGRRRATELRGSRPRRCHRRARCRSPRRSSSAHDPDRRHACTPRRARPSPPSARARRRAPPGCARARRPSPASAVSAWLARNSSLASSSHCASSTRMTLGLPPRARPRQNDSSRRRRASGSMRGAGRSGPSTASSAILHVERLQRADGDVTADGVDLVGQRGEVHVGREAHRRCERAEEVVEVAR